MGAPEKLGKLKDHLLGVHATSLISYCSMDLVVRLVSNIAEEMDMLGV